LQDGLNCSDGFAELRTILLEAGQTDLALRFNQFAAAVNVLKHGKGRSYEKLLEMHGTLPFLLRERDQHLFSEGDVSESYALVVVDDAFIRSCGDLVQASIEAVQKVRPDVHFG
jgi:hypothetical protein